MHQHKTVELNAASEREVDAVLNESLREHWQLDQLAVVMDADGARYYTLILRRNVSLISGVSIPGLMSIDGGI